MKNGWREATGNSRKERDNIYMENKWKVASGNIR
jgi:hypothetical protein